MNSRQLNFYLLPEEQPWFNALLHRTDDLAVVSELSASGAPILGGTTVVQAMGEEPLRIYLAKPSDLTQIVGKAIPAKDQWLLDQVRSPVVEFSRCYFDGKSLLRRGRLYVVTRYYEEDVVVEKPKEFLAWANALLAIARKHLIRRDDGDYIAPLALKAVEAGTVKLALM